jgi:NhaP-type Na+/H+ or K+/H+ antiporter
VFYLLRTVLQLADRLLDELNSGALPFDPIAIAERIHASGIDNPATNLASLVCVLC